MLNFRFVLAASVLALVPGNAFAGNEISNDMSKCSAGKGSAVLISLRGIKSATGKVRVQAYKATKAAWLSKGAWINRIETGASSTSMNICMPVPAAGTYGIAVRHDANGNGKTDIRKDGGGFSNNPKLSIFNLGKPSVSTVAFRAGEGVTKITINMQYF
jgi:uncharacterized protein (DUF2141 family)